jgi:molybdopterin synthase catalytic subunit
MSTTIRVQVPDFDVNAELELLARENRQIGAIASFVGLVRADDGLVAMTLEHYPDMTEREIGTHITQARSRWPIESVTVVHRVGRLMPGARIVLVAVSSKHRAAAFEACEFLVDFLKTRAPFWKLEERAEATTWVGAKASDDRAAERWQ